MSGEIFFIFQLLIETFCYRIVRIALLRPIGEMPIVIQFVLESSKWIYLAHCLHFLEHLVHAFGEVAFLLTFPYHVERIFHHTPDNIPLLLRLDIDLDPKSQYVLQLIRIDPIYKKGSPCRSYSFRLLIISVSILCSAWYLKSTSKSSFVNAWRLSSWANASVSSMPKR